MIRMTFKLALLIIITPMLSCTSSETMSKARHFDFIMGENSEDVIVYIHEGAGKYTEVIPVDSLYSVDIPAMRGGYSQFLGVNVSKHDPEEYPILRLVKKGIIIRELSIRQIEMLRKDKNGVFLVSL
jgi:hypothetical protein